MLFWMICQSPWQTHANILSTSCLITTADFMKLSNALYQWAYWHSWFVWHICNSKLSSIYVILFLLKTENFPDGERIFGMVYYLVRNSRWNYYEICVLIRASSSLVIGSWCFRLMLEVFVYTSATAHAVSWQSVITILSRQVVIIDSADFLLPASYLQEIHTF